MWTWDFIHDRTVDGRPLKCLSIIDEYTRECLCLEAARSFKAADVLDHLGRVMGEYGVPKHLRSDNGPEFIAASIQEWLAKLDVATLYIEPGAPWQNGYAESFNSRLRDEFLEMNYFYTLSEACYLIRARREEYNTKRPHSSLGNITPSEFAALCVATGSASLRSAPPVATRNDRNSPVGTQP